MNKLCLIHNPAAGRGQAREQIQWSRDFAATYPGAELQLTEGPGHAEELAGRAVAEKYDLVVVAGGDGTIHEVVNGIMAGREAPVDRPVLGIYPLGTANDLAQGLGFTSCPDAALERLVRGQPRAIDIGRITSGDGTSRIFSFSAGVGFLGAAAAESFRVRRVQGTLLYLWASFRALRLFESKTPWQIKLGNGRIIERGMMALSVNNVSRTGGCTLTPGALVDDGLFDVLLVDYVRRVKRPWVLVQAWTGRHLAMPEVNLTWSNRLEIRADEYLPVHVDGEPFPYPAGMGTHLTIELLPRALPVMV